MQDVVAPVSYIPFDIEASLEMQLGALPLPFPGMDSEWKLVLGNYPHEQNQIPSCYRFSCYYRFSDIAINSVNPPFI